AEVDLPLDVGIDGPGGDDAVADEARLGAVLRGPAGLQPAPLDGGALHAEGDVPVPLLGRDAAAGQRLGAPVDGDLVEVGVRVHAARLGDDARARAHPVRAGGAAVADGPRGVDGD